MQRPTERPLGPQVLHRHCACAGRMSRKMRSVNLTRPHGDRWRCAAWRRSAGKARCALDTETAEGETEDQVDVVAVLLELAQWEAE